MNDVVLGALIGVAGGVIPTVVSSLVAWRASVWGYKQVVDKERLHQESVRREARTKRMELLIDQLQVVREELVLSEKFAAVVEEAASMVDQLPYEQRRLLNKAYAVMLRSGIPELYEACARVMGGGRLVDRVAGIDEGIRVMSLRLWGWDGEGVKIVGLPLGELE